MLGSAFTGPEPWQLPVFTAPQPQHSSLATRLALHVGVKCCEPEMQQLPGLDRVSSPWLCWQNWGLLGGHCNPQQ